MRENINNLDFPHYLVEAGDAAGQPAERRSVVFFDASELKWYDEQGDRESVR